MSSLEACRGEQLAFGEFPVFAWIKSDEMLHRKQRGRCICLHSSTLINFDSDSNAQPENSELCQNNEATGSQQKLTECNFGFELFHCSPVSISTKIIFTFECVVRLSDSIWTLGIVIKRERHAWRMLISTLSSQALSTLSVREFFYSATLKLYHWMFISCHFMFPWVSF